MDPTMGETLLALPAPAVTGQATFGSEEPAVTAAVVEAPATAPETNYPVGKVDFNKPFEVFGSYDDTIVHSEPRVLAVLAGNSYPVVVISTNETGDEVVNQFDTDGDSVEGDLKIANVTIGERVMFIVITREGREFGVLDELFGTEGDAISDHGSNSDFYAVLPVTIPATKQAADVEEESDEDHDEDHEDHDDTVTSTIEAQPEGSVRVNGFYVKPGDKVSIYRKNRGQRTCTVIKTRDDQWKSLYIQADNGGEEPYWARNVNVKYRIG